jgi:hypothetical protein
MPSCYFCGVRNAFIASHAPGACRSSHATYRVTACSRFRESVELFVILRRS